MTDRRCPNCDSTRLREKQGLLGRLLDDGEVMRCLTCKKWFAKELTVEEDDDS